MTLLKLRKTTTLLNVIVRGDDEMSKGLDNLQHAEKGQPDAVTIELASFTTIFQAIVDEGTDYTKKAVEARLTCVEKLLGAKSLETVIQIQYAKTAYAAFVAYATKMGELHSNLAKAAFKPAELAIAENSASFDLRVGSARNALPDQMDSFDWEGVAQHRKVGTGPFRKRSSTSLNRGMEFLDSGHGLVRKREPLNTPK